MGPYFFGDNYGGVQSAQQASENSDRSLMAALIAAQQQAQSLAMQQQRIPIEAMDANRRFALQQQQQAESSRQFDVGLAETKRQADQRNELGLAGLDLSEDKLWQQANQFNSKLDQAQEQIGRIGQPAADNFGSTLVQREEARNRFQEAQKALVSLDERGRVFKAQDLLTYDSKAKQWRAMRPDVPVLSRLAQQLNGQIEKAQLEASQAKDSGLQAEKAFTNAARAAQSAGFQPDLQQGVLVHPKTGHVFSFLQTVQNSPKVRKFDPKSGKFLD